MDAEQQYIFDLQGYIVLKGVVSEAVVKACNEALDRFEALEESELPPPLCFGNQRYR